MHHLSFFLKNFHLVPALAQLQCTTADRDHAIGVLFPSDENFHFKAFWEAFLIVGDHTKAGFAFWHETGGFAPNIDIHTVAFEGNHGALNHLTRRTDGGVFIQSGEEGFFVEIEVVHAAGFAALLSFGFVVG